MVLPVSSSPMGSGNKEKELLNTLFPEEGEKFPVVEKKEMEIDQEVQPFIEKIEKEIYLTKPVTDDYGQPLVTAPSAQPVQIILPVNQGQFLFGLQQKVTESIRWLAEWCLRIIKIFGPKAVFEKENHES